MGKIILAAMCLFFVSWSFAASNIYKWTDKEGRVHFGDPTDMPVVPEPPARKPNGANTIKRPTALDDRTWNQAVDRAEQTPTGGAGRSLSQFAGPDRPAPSPSYHPSTTVTITRTYTPSPTTAIMQNSLERQAYEQQKQQKEAAENKRRQLVAECERNRGTDCKSDSALQYMENANKPRGAFR